MSGKIVPAGGQAWEGEADFRKGSPPTTPPDNGSKKLPALRDKRGGKKGKIGSAADKYKAAQDQLLARCRANSLASKGEYVPGSEPSIEESLFVKNYAY